MSSSTSTARPSGLTRTATGAAPSSTTTSPIKGTLQALLEGGAQLDQDVKDVGGGRLIASIKDADGNLIGILQDT